MNKLPQVEHDKVTGMLSGRCAANWYDFLADEYSFEGDQVKADSYKMKATSMKIVMPASVKDKVLETEIEKYTKKRIAWPDFIAVDV